MSTKTPNLGLTKPDPSDYYNIDVFNENADKIDAALKVQTDTDNAIKADIKNVKIDLANFDKRYKIGDVITTARTDLGNNWALCNGDQVYKSEYPEAYELLKEGDYVLWNNSSNMIKTGYAADTWSIYAYGDNFLISAGHKLLVVDANGNLLNSADLSISRADEFCYLNGNFIAIHNEPYSNWKDFLSADNLNGPWSIFRARVPDMSKIVYDGSHYVAATGYCWMYTESIPTTTWNESSNWSNYSYDSPLPGFQFLDYLDGVYIAGGGYNSDTMTIYFTNSITAQGTVIKVNAPSGPNNATFYKWTLKHENNIWYIIAIIKDANSKYYTYYVSASSLNNLSSGSWKEIQSPDGGHWNIRPIYYYGSDSIKFMNNASLYSYKFGDSTAELIHELSKSTHGSNWSTSFVDSVLADDSGNPIVYVGGRPASDGYLAFPNRAFLPTISTDTAHNYIKVDGD